MLDRILYALASPLAREIIDSLRDEPGEWKGNHTTQVIERGHWWYHVEMNGLFFSTSKYIFLSCPPLTRLALRRAVNKWRNTHG